MPSGRRSPWRGPSGSSGIDARVVHRDRPPAQLADFPGIGRHRDRRHDPGRHRRRRGARVRGPRADRALRASTGCRSSTSIIIRATAATARCSGSTAPRPRAAEMVFEIIAELGVPAHRRHGHAAVRRGGHRHGLVPLPGRLAAHVLDCARLLEAGADPVSVARKLYRQQHSGAAPPAGRRPADPRDRPERPPRDAHPHRRGRWRRRAASRRKPTA